MRISRRVLVLASLTVAGCAAPSVRGPIDPARIDPADIVSITRTADAHLAAVGLATVEAAPVADGERELRLWPSALQRSRLLLARSGPSGSVVEWWAFSERVHYRLRDGEAWGETVDLSSYQCRIRRSSEAGTACLLARQEGATAAATVQRLDSLRQSVVQVSSPGTIQVDGRSLLVEGREGARHFRYRLFGVDLRADSASSALYRMAVTAPS